MDQKFSPEGTTFEVSSMLFDVCKFDENITVLKQQQLQQY